MKKFIMPLFILSMLSFIFSVAHAELRSTDNLRKNERNLDILSDKTGSLHQLIEEIQGFSVIRATSAGSGSVIVDDTVLEDDTIAFAMVLSSANIVQASSTTMIQTLEDGSQAGITIIKSKILGTMGNTIKLNFNQIPSTNTTYNGGVSTVVAGQLLVYTTGYAIDVWLSTTGVVTFATGCVNGTFSSVTDVSNAIKANDGANALVSIETNTSTRTVLSQANTISLTGGQGSILSPNVISGDFFTCGDGIITVGNNTPISANDGLILYIYKRPIE